MFLHVLYENRITFFFGSIMYSASFLQLNCKLLESEIKWKVLLWFLLSYTQHWLHRCLLLPWVLILSLADWKAHT